MTDKKSDAITESLRESVYGKSFGEKLKEIERKYSSEKYDSYPAVPVVPEGELVVVCIDNTGIEDRFDLNIQYVAVAKESDFQLADTIKVYDKNGVIGRYVVSRFRLVPETIVPLDMPESVRKSSKVNGGGWEEMERMKINSDMEFGTWLKKREFKPSKYDNREVTSIC